VLKQVIQKMSVTAVLIGISSFAVSSNVFAHVTVKPAEVVSSGFQTFSVNVPNEKSISTVSVKVLIPEGLAYVQPNQKAGWQIAVEKEGSGLDTTVTSITWSGNEVKADFRDEFTFSGQVPDKTTELQWKAYQTYADGTVVAWDKASNGNGHETEDENSGPFSVTNVVARTSADVSVQDATQAVANAQASANNALYVGVAGIALGLAGIYFGTRKK
jgi:uncharacterized protein YcnI